LLPGTIRESANNSNAIHELLMDVDIDSDEGQVDTWSGGVSGGIPKTTTVAHEADDHKESLHFFPSNQ
jgi:orotate phosphoribosyltransferase-like protein